MSQSFLYQSNDANAPTLCGVAGSLKNLLKFVLVDGYGTKSGLGWTLEYEVGNDAIFRNDSITGTGMFVKFSENIDGANITTVNTYDVANGIDILGNGMIKDGYIRHSPVASTTPYPWKIIGDNKAIILIIKATDGGPPADTVKFIYFIGDYNPLTIDNMYNFCMLVPTNNSTLYGGSAFKYKSPGSTTDECQLMRGIDQQVGSIKGGLMGGRQNDESAYKGSIAANPWSNYFPCPINGAYQLFPVYIHTSQGMIGTVPGIFTTFLPASDGTGNSLPYIETVLSDKIIHNVPVVVDFDDFQHNGWNNRSYLSFVSGEGFRL